MILKKILFLSLLFLIFLPWCAGAAEKVILSVPFTSEVPDGQWIKPWNNACEEASIVMVQEYYAGKNKMTKTEAKNLMNPLFKIEDKIFGSNADTDAFRTNKLINEYTSFGSKIVDNPTLDDIKKELKAGRPVITFHYAKDIPNSNHRWRAGGSYYHVMVIVGYDDNTEEFITNDSGDPSTGLDYRYKYDIILSTLHDFNHQTRKADGLARVLFTWSKTLVKAKNSNRIYLISHDIKQYITHPDLFKVYGWKWGKIKIVLKSWIDSLENGPAITK